MSHRDTDNPLEALSDAMAFNSRDFAEGIIALRAAIDGRQDAQHPPLGIEAALEYAWDDGNASGLDGWTGPGRGAGEVDQQAIYNRDRAIRTALEKLGETPRPPLGYVVAGIREDGPTSLCPGFFGSVSAAIESVGRSDTPRGVRYAVAELREVQP